MNTEQLQTFLCVAQVRNFSLAAKQMIVTQSTVSKRIGELEKEVGQALFERGRAGVRLTLAGKSFLEYAGRIVSMEEKAIEQINRTPKYRGHLVLGTVYAYFDVYLRDKLERFMELHPDISIRVVFGHTGQLLSEIRNARLDIAFTHHAYDHPDYLCEPIERDDVILVTDGANRARQGGVPLGEVKELPLIGSNFLYASTHGWLFPRDQQFQLEMDIAAHVLPFLKRGNRYALLARSMVKAQLDAGALIEIAILDGEIPQVRYYRVLRKDGTAQMAVRAWLAFEEK